MKIDHSRQSAVEALDAFLSAAHQPDALRVSKSGEVQVTNGAVTLFNRAVNTLRSTFDKDYKPTDWHASARSAVIDKLAKEVSMFGEGMRRDDMKILDKLVSRISDPAQPGRPSSWRVRFTEEIAALKETHTADPLVSALEMIDFFGQRGNATIFPHVRKHLAGEGSLPQALEMGLKSYVKNDRGLDQATADNGARTLTKIMINYRSNVYEAIDIAGCAGRMIIDGSIAGQHMPALPLAYLRVHHGLSLDMARQVYGEVHSAGKTVAEARNAIPLMLTYDLPFKEANEAASLAASMGDDTELQTMSVAQKAEIAWLRLHAGKSPNEAKLISLSRPDGWRDTGASGRTAQADWCGSAAHNQRDDRRSAADRLAESMASPARRIAPTDQYRRVQAGLPALPAGQPEGRRHQQRPGRSQRVRQ